MLLCNYYTLSVFQKRDMKSQIFPIRTCLIVLTKIKIKNVRRHQVVVSWSWCFSTRKKKKLRLWVHSIPRRRQQMEEFHGSYPVTKSNLLISILALHCLVCLHTKIKFNSFLIVWIIYLIFAFAMEGHYLFQAIPNIHARFSSQLWREKLKV